MLPRISCSTTAALAALLLLASPAAAAPTPVDLDEVVASLGVGPKPSDYVIAVDTSGSMADEGRWQKVNESLNALGASLLPRDHVSLISFDNAAVTRFEGTIDNRPERLAASLPKVPAGKASDIGLGISAGLDALARDSANDVAAFVLVTDGEHRAAKGSPFEKLDSPAWQELRTRADELLGKRSIAAYAVAMKAGADSVLLRKVFDEVTDVEAADITDQFSRLDADLVKVQAAAELRSDLGAGVRADWSAPLADLDPSGGTRDLELTLTSTTSHVPLELSDLKVVAAPLQVSATGLPKTVELAPGQSVTLPVAVSWTGPGRGYLQLEATFDSAWKQVLVEDLGLEFAPRVNGSTSIQTAAPFDVGPYLRWGMTGLGVLAAIAAIWFGYRITRPELIGSLSISTGDELAETVLAGRSMRLRHGGVTGSARAVRRKNAAGEQESGVQVKVRSGDVKRRAKLFEGDVLEVGEARVAYTSARSRIVALIES